jgi:hypothetical protein
MHGTAAPGTREAQATSSIFATQKCYATSCRSAASVGEATAIERVGNLGVTIFINTSLQRGVMCGGKTQPLQRLMLR